MVDLEGIQLLVRTIDIKEKAAEGNENVTSHSHISCYANDQQTLAVSLHIVSLSFLKSVDLPMADVVVLVRKRLFAHADFAPPLSIILASI